MPVAPLAPRGVPFEPGLLSRVAAGRAAWLAFQNTPRAEALGEIRRVFPELGPAQAGKLVSQAERAAAVLARFERGFDWQKLERQQIPRNPDLPDAYRYNLRVTLRDLETGQQTTAFVSLDERSNLSLGELRQRAQDFANQYYVEGGDSPILREAFADVDVETAGRQFQATDLEVIQVERRT